METDFSDIKAIFLDIGGVILTNGWGHESRQKAAEVFGFDYTKMNDLHNFILNVYETGSITLDEYLDIILFYESRDFTRKEFKEFIRSQSVQLPHMLDWLKSWKKQLRLPVFAINNEALELNEYRIEKFGLHQIFDGFFSSCYVGYRKPNPEIFKTAMRFAHTKPEESLYFDDRKRLTQIAKKLGINAIQHQTFGQTSKVLQTFISN